MVDEHGPRTHMLPFYHENEIGNVIQVIFQVPYLWLKLG